MVKTDSPTLRRALAYLYTGTCDDTSPTSTGACNLSATDQGHISVVPKTEDVAAEPNQRLRLHLPSDSNSENEMPTSFSGPQTKDRPSEGVHDLSTRSTISAEPESWYPVKGCCTGRHESACRNSRLRAKALVYFCADYHQIHNLKLLAVEKFENALEIEYEEAFGETCRLIIYRPHPSHGT